MKISIDISTPHLETGYPHVLKRMEALWGYNEEFNVYINSLAFDERGDRAGFAPEAMKEIFQLSKIHDAIYPPKKLEAARSGWMDYSVR